MSTFDINWCRMESSSTFVFEFQYLFWNLGFIITAEEGANWDLGAVILAIFD